MSVLTDALSKTLEIDFSGVLTPYQISKLSDPDYGLWPDATPREAAAWFLGKSLLKKYNDSDKPSKTACALALEKFLECNQRNEDFAVVCENDQDAILITMLREELYSFWYPGRGTAPLVSTFNELYERGKLGKGSNRCARDTNFYTKVYDSRLSHTTDTLRFVWERLTTSDPRHLLAEKLRSSRYGFVQVEGNSLSFVNKTTKIARSICTEPTINMWFQLGMASFLEERLKSYFDISLDIQPDINRTMARLGSITGGLATIDLESASDSLSLGMLQAVLPKDMYLWLTLLRSPKSRLPSGEEIVLHSIGTMGNGFTFPLQTCLFAAIVRVVYKYMNIPCLHGNSMSRNYTVFGDDIIVVTDAVPLLYRLLALLGLRVNYTKSFVDGLFRESCGSDFYDGTRVRGVYVKSLRSIQDYAIAINGINRWSAQTGIPVPTLVGTLLRDSRKHGRLLYGPPDEADDSCVHVPLDMARGVTRTKFGTAIYKKWVSRPAFLEFNPEDDSFRTVGKEVLCQYNPHGLALTHLLGVIRGYRIPLRREDNKVSYGMKHGCVSPNWGHLSRTCQDLGLDWRHWSSAVRRNM
jgi:hypothetical protein